MVSIVLHDEKQIMPASAELCGEYGEKDVFVGVPCVIGKNGVEEVVELSLNEREKEELKNPAMSSAATLRWWKKKNKPYKR